ncbi:MAG: tRNA (N6-isopentenyl adenosine(37)-C2)-methylthiotransferase MiaB [Cytophagales bacterium]
MKQVISDIDIITKENITPEQADNMRTTEDVDTGKKRKLYIESYGCQMNFSDSEIVTSVMNTAGFDTTSKFEEADVVFLNTCSIRDNAEQKVRVRLSQINQAAKKNPNMIVGVLGCMAERLKSKLIEEEKIVDLVVGPDAYRTLPALISEVDNGQKAVNVFLSREETYDDITPLRLNTNGVTAFISIMRGCDNMCSFCVVPYTRGRERSRDPKSILKEAHDLVNQGYKEVTLLGQNVDSYKWDDENGVHVNFAQLLEKVALVSPELRVRFSTSHPKDITDEVLHTMAKYENICKYIHLPAQSGNSRILDLMNRTYDREWYLGRVEAIRRILGDECGISTDMITGFCTETEEEHQDSVSLMELVQYDYAYMFAYSERPGTPAAKKLVDDIPADVKNRRLNEIIAILGKSSLERNKQTINQVHKVLVEGYSKRSDEFLCGRNSANRMIVFPKKNYKKGDYVNVLVKDCTSATLIGEAVD